MKIGIMGGSFDPVHMGHLILAQHVMNVIGLDKVVFVPTGNPPHKRNISSAKDRLEMVRLSISGNPGFSLCDFETAKEGTSYSIDTVRYLKEQYPGASVHFITGFDSYLTLETWKEYKTLIREVKFISVYRSSNSMDEFIEFTKRHEIDAISINMPIVEISSSQIRNMLERNEDVRYLVHEDVYRYIQEKGLYR